MKIIALVENTSQSEVKARHGLSLYIETRKHRLLFDVGPDGTLFHNAGMLGINLAKIDTVIISHGHAGVVNIMDRVKCCPPKVCVGGFYLYDPATRKAAPESLLNEIALALKGYKDTRFYTCHCTGEKVFQYMKRQAPNFNYLSCGETIHI